MLNHIKAIIDNLKNGTPSRTSRYDIVRFQKLYNKIFLTRRGVIRVGGSAHDNTATIDVIADVVNAVRSSLEYGFVLANGVTMHYVLTGINNAKNDLFKQAFLYGLNAVRDAVYYNSPYEKFEPSYNTSVDILTSSNCVITRSESWNTSTPLIIQPANIDIQILERFGEVALKFLCSNKVVSPGGVYLHEEDLT